MALPSTEPSSPPPSSHKGPPATPSTVASTPTPSTAPRGRHQTADGEDAKAKKNAGFLEDDAAKGKSAAKYASSCSSGIPATPKLREDPEKKVATVPPGKSSRPGRATAYRRGYSASAGRKMLTVKGRSDQDGHFLPSASPMRNSRLAAREAWSEGQGDTKTDKSGRGRSETLNVPNAAPPRPYRGADSERVSRCTREAVWSACDVFWMFDTHWTGEITRKGYIDGLGDPPTIEKLRMLRRSGLEHRFRKSVTSVTLREWISMIWPASTEQEFELMMRWAQLREAYSIVHNKHFRCLDTEMNKVYNLIDPDKTANAELPIGELVRANLLTREEVLKIFRTEDLHNRISRETFKNQVHPHLKSLYVSADTKSKMKSEEEIAGQLDTAFRSGLAGGIVSGDRK